MTVTQPVFEESITFSCLEVQQPIGTFYIGIIDAAVLTRITYTDVRRIADEPREVETYLGIERPLNQKRVAELKAYVETVDATFPSSVILAVDAADAYYDGPRNLLVVRDKENVARVLDGQHRIAGLEGYGDGVFQVLVTIFVDIDIEEQALIFATINLEQTKVNKSLVYDLYEYAKQRSPQKTAHNIAVLLDREIGSPLRGKIKILGTARDRGETISQAQFVDMLLPLMSADPRRDRDQLKRGREIPRASRSEEQILVFRNMFVDGRDAEIARVLWNYFSAVEQRWQRFWRDVVPGNVLNKTTGFRALMQVLPAVYLTAGKPGSIPSIEQFDSIFQRITLPGEDITPEKYPPGSSGQASLRKDLLSQAGLG
jgi:DGQHR domain-containing protein